MKCIITLIAIFAVAAPLAAASTNLTVGGASDITLFDAAGQVMSAGRVDVFSDAGSVYMLNYRVTSYDGYDEAAHCLTLHSADGSYIRTLATDATTGYSSFVLRQGGTVYVGVGDSIASVPLTASSTAFTNVATLGNNFAMEFYGSTAYAVANPGWGGNKIYQVDLSGNDQHTVVANVGGYSCGLAFDAEGNLYYGTSGLKANSLVEYSAAQVAAGGQTLGNAQTLSQLPMGAGGIAVDDAGNILFTLNSWGSMGQLAVVEAGKDYSAYGSQKFDVLSGVNQWCTSVNTIGTYSLYDGGVSNGVFVDGGGYISEVPEPATMALLGLGGLALLRRRAVA